MKVRPLQPSDIPFLKHYAEVSGFPYPDFDDPHIEAFLVVVDSEDRPIAGCVAKRLVELYGYFDPAQSPATKRAILKAMHQGMAEALREKMYNGAEIFLPPKIAARFGRRLERIFGWLKNWQSWTIRF